MKRFIWTLSFALAGVLTGALADESAEAGEQKFLAGVWGLLQRRDLITQS